MIRSKRSKSRKFEGAILENSVLKSLLEACSEGSPERVESLIVVEKIDITNLEGDLEKTPLYVAVSNFTNEYDTDRHKKVVELLLKYGADPFRADHHGRSVASKIFREKELLIDVLLEYLTDTNKTFNSSGLTTLHLAVEHCSKEVVTKLLERNANVNIFSGHPVPIFHVAVLNERYDIIDALLQYGADINERSSEGWTTLHCAQSGDMVRELGKRGVDVNARAFFSEDTPLISVVRTCSKCELISALLGCGADYKLTNREGKTAFQYINDEIIRGFNLKTNGDRVEVFIEHVRRNICADVDDTETRRIRSLAEELRDVRSEKMGDSTVTFWKMMTSSTRVVARLARNEGIARAVRTNRFHSFSFLLKKKYCEGLKWRRAEDAMREFLNELFSNKLPSNVSDIIIVYLSWKDLNHLEFRSPKKKLME